jgi:hypothetical protein
MLENGLEGVLERIPSDLRASFWARSRRAELSASFTRFPGSFGQPWEVINLTPTDDFIGALCGPGFALTVPAPAPAAARR